MHNSEYVASGGPFKDAGARLIFEIATVFANYQITTEILAAAFATGPAHQWSTGRRGISLTGPRPCSRPSADHPLSDEGMKARRSPWK